MTFSLPFGLRLIILAGLGLAALPAHAQIFQVTAKGTLSQVQNPDKLFDASVAVGVPFTYTQTFDLSAPETSGKDSASSDYTKQGEDYGSTVTVGDYTITPSFNNVSYLSVQPLLKGSSHYSEGLSTQRETVSSSNPNAPVINSAMCTLLLYFRESMPLTSKTMPPLSTYNFSRVSQLTSLIVNFFGPGDSNKYQDQLIGHITSLTATLQPLSPASAQPTLAQLTCPPKTVPFGE